MKEWTLQNSITRRNPLKGTSFIKIFKVRRGETFQRLRTARQRKFKAPLSFPTTFLRRQWTISYRKKSNKRDWWNCFQKWIPIGGLTEFWATSAHIRTNFWKGLKDSDLGKTRKRWHLRINWNRKRKQVGERQHFIKLRGWRSYSIVPHKRYMVKKLSSIILVRQSTKVTEHTRTLPMLILCLFLEISQKRVNSTRFYSSIRGAYIIWLSWNGFTQTKQFTIMPTIPLVFLLSSTGRWFE